MKLQVLVRYPLVCFIGFNFRFRFVLNEATKEVLHISAEASTANHDKESCCKQIFIQTSLSPSNTQSVILVHTAGIPGTRLKVCGGGW